MKVLKPIVPTLLALFLVSVTFGQKKSEKNVAAQGYDVVAYFNTHKAVKGEKSYKVKDEGVTYLFSSAKNAAEFKANASKYKPAYDGYCAFAMAMKGAKVPSDPNTFKIRDGKLYLFFNDYYEGKKFNTIVPWNNANEAEMVAKANANWKKLK